MAEKIRYIPYNDKDVGDIIFNWKGQIIIQLFHKGKPYAYLMKYKQWKKKFELYDEAENLVLVASKSSPWWKVKVNYKVNIHKKESILINESELIYIAVMR